MASIALRLRMVAYVAVLLQERHCGQQELTEGLAYAEPPHVAALGGKAKDDQRQYRDQQWGKNPNIRELNLAVQFIADKHLE